MKRFLFLTVIGAMLVTAAQAQSPSLTVTNNTNCNIHYRLIGDVGAGCNVIAPVYQSRILTLIPGATVTFSDPSTVPGGISCAACTPAILGAGDSFIAAELLQNSLACGGTVFGFVGEACTGYPAVQGPYNVEGAGCALTCPVANATWAGGATLTFN